MSKKICFFTGTRAEYGLLGPVIRAIDDFPDIETQLLVSGTHLSNDFGETWKEIEADGVFINEKVNILSDDCEGSDICCSMGLAIKGYGDAFKRLLPDVLVVLGDRYEALAVTIAATALGIPIAHIHGGELTLGAMDDAFRHAITKMSHLHLTSNEEHRKRVIQMGESPQTVFNVGALGVENALESKLFSKQEVYERLGISPSRDYLIATYHSATLSLDPSLQDLKNILRALKKFPQYSIVFTGSNADQGGNDINEYLQQYANDNEDFHFFMSLGSRLYYSAAKYASLVIGNSSSGIIEVPSFGVPVVNLGTRQLGRMHSKDIVNCEKLVPTEIVDAIHNAVKKILTKENPYHKDGSSKAIASLLNKWSPQKYQIKYFYSGQNDKQK